MVDDSFGSTCKTLRDSAWRSLRCWCTETFTPKPMCLSDGSLVIDFQMP